MFVQDTNMQRDRLRQGDILEGIPFPLLGFASLSVLGHV